MLEVFHLFIECHYDRVFMRYQRSENSPFATQKSAATVR